LADLIKQPRFWLLIWSGLGAAFLLYVIVTASVSPRESGGPSALDRDQALLTGEMADFEYTFPPRGVSSVGFDHEGETVSLADFRGKAVLVNFWATTCAPCLVELPSLDRLEIKNLKLYADPDLRFAFSVGGADVLPTSILYDARGEEIGRIVGEADWSSEEARQLILSATP